MSQDDDNFVIKLPSGLKHSDQVPEHGQPSRQIWLTFPCLDVKAVAEQQAFKSTYNYSVELVMQQAGLATTDLFITSVSKTPTENYLMTNRYRVDERAGSRFTKLVRTHKPKLVILVGEACLNYFTGNQGIDNWRGSFLWSDKLQTWVLPIYDGRRMFLEQELRFITQIDLMKLRKWSPDMEQPRRNYTTNPTYEQCVAFLEYLIDPAPRGADPKRYSVDIETTNGQLACIGFSDSDYSAFVVPFMVRDKADRNRWTTEQDKRLLLLLARALGATHSEKIFQNAMFDMTFLWERCNILVRGRIWDTMVMHNLKYPDFKKNLGLQTSIYTMDPYYKDEGKIWENPNISDKQFWTYNAKDADVTYRIFHEIKRQMLAERDLLHWNKAFKLSSIQEHVWKMSLRGMRVDVVKKERLREETAQELEALKHKLHQLTGRALNPGSSQQLIDLLYNEYGLPEKFDRKTGNPTASKHALKELKKDLQGKPYKEGGHADLRRHSVIQVIDRIIDYSELKKLHSSYYKTRISDDGRFRSTFAMGGRETDKGDDFSTPDTGRLSSSKYLDGTGNNMQNFPKKAKQYILPDLDAIDPTGEPHILMNVDLAQADARVVAYVSGDPGLIALFKTDEDYHSSNAKNIWNLAHIDMVTSEQRQLAKRGGHACNYGAQDMTLSLALGIPFQVAKDFRARYFGTYPRLKNWHADIERTIKRTRTLITPMGRKRVYLGRVDVPHAINSAIAFPGQSTVADVINEGLLNIETQRKGRFPWYAARLLLQCHDSLVYSVRRSIIDDFIPFVRECVEIPVHATETFVIPADFEVGYTYASMQRYLPPDTERSVRQALAAGTPPLHIAKDLRVNKDAVIALAEGQTWR